MYVPAVFAETRLAVLYDFIRRHDFAAVVTAGARGLIASHIPVVLLPDRGPFGALQFHLTRPNEQCEDLAAGASTLAIFQGPHSYISPTWYAGAVAAPTWNYIVVHATGTPRLLDDSELRDHLNTLVAAYESPPTGWSSAQLPADLFDSLQKSVMGFQIDIQTLQGKWKLGQNRTRADREGAIAGLRKAGTHEALQLAELIAASIERGGAE